MIKKVFDYGFKGKVSRLVLIFLEGLYGGFNGIEDFFGEGFFTEDRKRRYEGVGIERGSDMG